MRKQRRFLTAFRQVVKVSVCNADCNVQSVLVISLSLMKLFHQLNHSLSSFHREAQLTVWQLKVVSNRLLLTQHVQVYHLSILWSELAWRPRQLERVALIDVRHVLLDEHLPSLLHSMTWREILNWLFLNWRGCVKHKLQFIQQLRTAFCWRWSFKRFELSESHARLKLGRLTAHASNRTLCHVQILLLRMQLMASDAIDLVSQLC